MEWERPLPKRGGVQSISGGRYRGCNPAGFSRDPNGDHEAAALWGFASSLSINGHPHNVEQTMCSLHMAAWSNIRRASDTYLPDGYRVSIDPVVTHPGTRRPHTNYSPAPEEDQLYSQGHLTKNRTSSQQ
jgi:hypothetical protein